MFGAATETKAENLPNLISVAELQAITPGSNRVIQSFRLEGVVRAVVWQRRLIALQDSSATALIELPDLDNSIRKGDRVSVTGENCLLIQNRFYTRFSTIPVVDNDGLHAPQLKSGQVFLEAGWQPIRLEWFNGLAAAALELAWEGPDIKRQKISNTLLRHRHVVGTNASVFEHGLVFSAYNDVGWNFLPDFMSYLPVKQGIATNFDLSYRVRAENTALVFSGQLNISKSGIYTFYITSDDGSKFYVGETKVSCKVIAKGGQTIPVESLKSLSDQPSGQWGELDGDVVFSSYYEDNLNLELAVKGARVSVTVIDGTSLFSTNLLYRQVRIAGIFGSSLDLDGKPFIDILVPSSEQLQIIGSLAQNELKASVSNLLTTVAQARQLKPAEAMLGIPVRFQGVVIGTSPSRLFLCDSTGGISVHLDNLDNWTGLPRVGELLEIEGKTIPGDFVPAITARKLTRLGNAPMPKPIRPNWDELMNGSLDCEYVEIQGVLTAASTNEITLLTRDGKITIDNTETRPLPQLPHYSKNEPLVGSVVRLRGGLKNEWDSAARRIIKGRFKFISPLVSVESTAPEDPFSIPTSKVSDLLWYNAQASGLQRTKVEGQIIFARAGEYFALDDKIGFRILTAEPVALQAGDLIEALGFPKVGGSSPVLQEATIRKIGQAPLPDPVTVSAEELLNLQHDSTLVQVDARLINYTTRPDAEIFQLQTGQIHFEAKVNLESSQPLSLSIGSRLRLVGVYAAMGSDRLGARADPFELLLNNPAAVTVIEMPPWWTVRRALGVAAALGGALCLSVVWAALLRRKVEVRTLQLQNEIEGRQKVERQRLMEQERTRVAQDLHDELGAGLTEMSLLGSLAGRPDVPAEEREHYLDQLTKSARSLVTGLDEIVWAINPQYDSVGSIATYYSFFAEEFLNLAGIACRLEVAGAFPKIPLDSKARHGIFLAFKEALNNVVRHSGASEVVLKINMVKDHLVISISDNGCGFTCGSANPGSDGLIGMRDRLQRLGGACDISSRLGQGTTIQFRLTTATSPAHSTA